jgi:DNA processing protein
VTRLDRMALSLVVEPGDPRLTELLAEHEPGQVLAALRGERTMVGVRLPGVWRERAHDLDRTVDAARARAEAARLRWVCPGDRAWPARLADLDHVAPLQGVNGAPLGLWVRGTGDLGRLVERSVAVVGARDCTTYGAECASDIGADLTDGGWTVVSGAAYGIDGCAHRGALAMNRPTVAVLACGADVDYPRSHATLLDRIAEEGVVVSEQAPGQTPLRSRFLSRNRLIAALSVGTVVVEAAVRSGSLNTLHWADQLGRTTMAVPGPVTSQASGGAHAAVREGRAVLVTGGRDVVAEVEGLGADEVTVVAPQTEFDLLPPTVRATLDGLDWHVARTVVEVASLVRLTAATVTSSLTRLEERGLAVRHGGAWLLARRADVD